MSLFISYYFDSNFHYVNTTADFNIISEINKHSFENIIKITPDEWYSINIDITDYIFNKYNIYINNIVFFDFDTLNSNHFVINDNIKVYLYIIDIFHCFNFSKFDLFNKLKYKGNLNYLLPYAYYNNIYNSDLIPNNNYFFPHSVIHNCTYNENPVNKVLLSGRGRKNEYRYPNRVKMYNLFTKNQNIIDYLKPDITYKVNKNDNYQFSTFGKKYIDKLNEYIACFCDDGNPQCSPNIFSKFFEIMSSGSLLLACNNISKPYFEKLGFIDRVDYYSISDDFLSDINYILDEKNREEINKIRLNGYNKVWKYHSSEFRMKELLDILNENTEKFIRYDDGIDNTQYLCNIEYSK